MRARDSGAAIVVAAREHRSSPSSLQIALPDHPPATIVIYYADVSDDAIRCCYGDARAIWRRCCLAGEMARDIDI